jgi:hypothetical protein
MPKTFISFILFMILFSNSFVFAAIKSFDLSMELSLDGQPITSSGILVNEGKKALLTQEVNKEKTFVEVVAQEHVVKNGQNLIKMSFIVGKMGKDGSRKIIGKPQVITAENERVRISVSSEAGQEQMDLTVTAKRVNKL